MNLKTFSDSLLLEETQRLCRLERRTTLEILHHLREIEARALFARTHSSLFDFCIKKLGFSEDQASRRISAMRLLRDVPEVEARVATGELKISQLAQVRSMVRTEKKEAGRTLPREEVAQLLTQVAGLSTRETERVLLAHSPALQEKRRTEEKVREVTPDLTSITFVADAELGALLEEAKLLLSHNGNPNPSTAEVMKRALQAWISAAKKKRGDRPQQNSSSVYRLAAIGPGVLGDRGDPNVPGEFRRTRRMSEQRGLLERPYRPKPQVPPARPESHRVASNTRANPPPPPAAARGALQQPQARTRSIPAALRREVFHRAEGQCQHISLSSEGPQRCASRHALEVHHVHPFALGGENTSANLELRCRTHNTAQARWDFKALQPLTQI
jgi:5-methylcytosine-specific restriction endonuclease McrA